MSKGVSFLLYALAMRKLIITMAMTAALFSACGGEEEPKMTQKECAVVSATLFQEEVEKYEAAGVTGNDLSVKIVTLGIYWRQALVSQCGFTAEEAVILTGG